MTQSLESLFEKDHRVWANRHTVSHLAHLWAYLSMKNTPSGIRSTDGGLFLKAMYCVWFGFFLFIFVCLLLLVWCYLGFLYCIVFVAKHFPATHFFQRLEWKLARFSQFIVGNLCIYGVCGLGVRASQVINRYYSSQIFVSSFRLSNIRKLLPYILAIENMLHSVRKDCNLYQSFLRLYS